MQDLKTIVELSHEFGTADYGKGGCGSTSVRDGALVIQLAEAFGGIEYMTDAAREFIKNWEVESCRQKQV